MTAITKHSILSSIGAAVLLGMLGGCGSPVGEVASAVAQTRQLQVEARRLNAQAMEAGDNLEACQKLLEQALSQDDLCAEAHNNLGVVLFKRGRLHEAAMHFQRSADLLPGSAGPLVNLALLHMRLGQWERALAHARDACTRDDHHAGANAVLAICLKHTGESSQYRQALDKLAMLTSDDSIRAWAVGQLRAEQDGRLTP